jgi:hypothetical protein
VGLMLQKCMTKQQVSTAAARARVRQQLDSRLHASRVIQALLTCSISVTVHLQQSLNDFSCCTACCPNSFLVSKSKEFFWGQLRQLPPQRLCLGIPNLRHTW